MKQSDNLNEALAKLPGYEPEDRLWNEIENKLGERSLREALHQLQEYEPADDLWDGIESRSTPRSNVFYRWLSVAAMIALVCGTGLWFLRAPGGVSYTQELLDARLRADSTSSINDQYMKIRDYCEVETTVCKSEDFRQLKEEYETLDTATTHLLQAMGNYNTDPELVRQLTMLEQGKANVLSQMAKLI
ncbi:hypothetical protein [Dyadobacter sp. 32]|uniref:hypothetical protein n=1 Tax=Dyadobacter sp. 32 TaxID=538966 RepID=UPI0011EBD2AD